MAWSTAALFVLALLLAVVVTLTVQTEWGTRLLWQTAARLAPGQLSGEFIWGNLRDGLQLRNIVYQDATKLVRADKLESAWHLQGWPLTLSVQYLRLGTVDVTLLPGPATPLILPEHLTLPLAIDLQSASLRQLVVRQNGSISHFNDIKLHANYDQVNHALTLEHAATPFGLVSGALQLRAVAPFNVTGAVGLTGKEGKDSYQVNTQLSGSLGALVLALDAKGQHLDGQATIDATPFAAVPIRRALVSIRGFDPKQFNPQWPHAKLDLRATLTPTGDTTGDLSLLTVTGPVSLTNAKPGASNLGLLPFESATVDVVLSAQKQQLRQLTIHLPGKATLTGGGEIQAPAQGALTLQAKGLDLHALHNKLKATQFNGPFSVQFSGETQEVKLELADPSLSLSARATINPEKITLHSAQLNAGASKLTFSATLARDAQAAYMASGSFHDFNPAQFFTSLPQFKTRTARINADFDAKGTLQPNLSAKVNFNVHDSQYDGLAMTGGGTVQFFNQRLLPSDAQLSIAGNSARLKGSFGALNDRLELSVDAPALDRLGFGLSGLLLIHGQIGGTLIRPVVNADYKAENLAFGAHRLAWLSGEAHTQGVPGKDPQAQVRLDLNARGLHSADLDLNQLHANIDGTYAKHTIRIDADGKLRGQALQMALEAGGQLYEDAQALSWKGVLRTLENRTSPRLQLETPMTVSVGPGRLELGTCRLTMASASIDLQSLVYRDNLVRSEGSVRSLELAQLMALQKQFTGKTPAIATDLVLDGRWNVTLADRADGFVEISRRGGDLRLNGQSALGLGLLTLRADLQGNRIDLHAQIKATRIGEVDGQGQIGLLREDGRLTIAARSPISGHMTASMPNLQTIAALAGPSIALVGKGAMDLTATGTLGVPVFSGTVIGDRLGLTLYDQGLHLHDGIARLRLENNIVELQRVEFKGGDGTLKASGNIALDGAARGLNATIVASKLQLLASPSAQLTVSGQAEAATAAGQLLVSGKFTVDHGLFNLPEKSAPQLDGDVVVLRGNQTLTAARINRKPTQQPAGAFTPRINVDLDLGNDFLFNGAGLKLRLAGVLNLRSEPGATPQAYGTVDVVEGSYEAFGTRLAIDSGVINFQGSLSDPNLNIVAMRRQQDIAAGVRVTGNARQPRVQLESEPDMPREEQLSWLVFGRSSSGGETGQAQAAVQGAALGLLNKFGTGSAARSIGLDTIAIGESKFGLSGAQVVNLGKEISDRLYIGYEQSLAGAESILKLIYTLTPHWSVALRGGAVTGADALYNNRFDKLH